MTVGIDFMDVIVNVQWPGFPADMLIYGYGGSGISHIRFGVRDGKPQAISEGSLFGKSFQATFDRSGPPAKPLPPMYHSQEAPGSYDPDTGKATIIVGSGFVFSGPTSYVPFTASPVEFDVRGKLTEDQYQALPPGSIGSKGNLFSIVSTGSIYGPSGPYPKGAYGKGAFFTATGDPDHPFKAHTYPNLFDVKIMVVNNKGQVVLTYPLGTNNMGTFFLFDDGFGHVEVFGNNDVIFRHMDSSLTMSSTAKGP